MERPQHNCRRKPARNRRNQGPGLQDTGQGMFAMGGYTGYLPSGTRKLLTARPDPIKQSPRWPHASRSSQSSRGSRGRVRPLATGRPGPAPLRAGHWRRAVNRAWSNHAAVRVTDMMNRKACGDIVQRDTGKPFVH